MLLFCISVTGPRLNFSSEVIHQRNIKSHSELDLIVICIHQYTHHSLERFLSRLTILVPYIHLDVYIAAIHKRLELLMWNQTCIKYT